MELEWSFKGKGYKTEIQNGPIVGDEGILLLIFFLPIDLNGIDFAVVMCLSMCVGMGYDPYTHKELEQIREMIQLKNYSHVQITETPDCVECYCVVLCKSLKQLLISLYFV